MPSNVVDGSVLPSFFACSLARVATGTGVGSPTAIGWCVGVSVADNMLDLVHEYACSMLLCQADLRGLKGLISCKKTRYIHIPGMYQIRYNVPVIPCRHTLARPEDDRRSQEKSSCVSQ
jgi:hypothetical protein